MNNIERAIRMQAANVTQKAMLDMVTTKLVRIKQIVDNQSPFGEDVSAEDIREVLSMTRAQTQEMRPTVEFDDAKVQEILDRAVNEMTEALLSAS